MTLLQGKNNRHTRNGFADPDQTSGEAPSEMPGKQSDTWQDRVSKWIALTGTLWTRFLDRHLSQPRDTATNLRPGQKLPQDRRWQLWQIETSIACNLNCIMCPWKEERKKYAMTADMTEEVWLALRPYLPETASVDFTGGGESLLHPKLAAWMRDASQAGCRTGFLTNGILLNRERSLEFIDSGVDWIGFSVDGATADVYEQIRKGSDFEVLCRNIAAVTALRTGKKPWILINFVLLPHNIDQLEKIVILAAELGVDQINFKQCDVIRGEHGRDYGLFASKETREIHQFQKILGRARRLARKKRIETTAFSFVPDELPICVQDPRNSFFVGHDGWVSPCINLAMGGSSSFLGKTVNIPMVHYGRLPEQDLMAIWDSDNCRLVRETFDRRSQVYDTVLGSQSFEPSLIKLNETLAAARKAMPEPPAGCQSCHYLYDI